ncbi:hypothetical protein [Caballeronia sp. BR00000012568055]|uniref:hypothetical protein n=1 Tax=Caballeronia sp. BR00000012568055 TaxID=2918761 RepID=UPI0023FA0771|nr:hypothetical protein [Caballeronia sp. BR00000012568055]
MSSLIIRDLSHSKELDRHAMSAVHGGTGDVVRIGSPDINVNVQQNLTQFQVTDVNVLNNSTVGPNFPGIGMLNVSPKQMGHLNATTSFF